MQSSPLLNSRIFPSPTEEAPYPWALTPSDPSLHTQPLASTIYFLSVDLRVLDVLYKWSLTVGYEAFHTWLHHSAWCLQGSSCCSVCVNFFFLIWPNPVPLCASAAFFVIAHQLMDTFCRLSHSGWGRPWGEAATLRSHLSGVCVGREASWLVSTCFCSLLTL